MATKFLLIFTTLIGIPSTVNHKSIHHIWSLIFYRPSKFEVLEMSVRYANWSHSAPPPHLPCFMKSWNDMLFFSLILSVTKISHVYYLYIYFIFKWLQEARLAFDAFILIASFFEFVNSVVALSYSVSFICNSTPPPPTVPVSWNRRKKILNFISFHKV